MGYESENSYLAGDLSLNMLRDFPLMDMVDRGLVPAIQRKNDTSRNNKSWPRVTSFLFVVPRGQITDILMCDNRLVKKNGRENLHARFLIVTNSKCAQKLRSYSVHYL